MPSLTNTVNSRLLKLLRDNEQECKDCKFFKVVKKFADENDRYWKRKFYQIKNKDKDDDSEIPKLG